jgi:hypothetical protein
MQHTLDQVVHYEFVHKYNDDVFQYVSYVHAELDFTQA